MYHRKILCLSLRKRQVVPVFGSLDDHRTLEVCKLTIACGMHTYNILAVTPFALLHISGR